MEPDVSALKKQGQTFHYFYIVLFYKKYKGKWNFLLVFSSFI